MRGANRFRYPGSPHSKRCTLGGGSNIGTEANALNVPPGESARKGETQRN